LGRIVAASQNNGVNARILRPRYYYYPEGDLLHAELGAAPSQVWRSIHKGLGVLKQGLVRRIGTDEDTDPWNDPWIPREGLFRPLTCLAAEPPQRVSEFINAATCTWDESKLRTYLLPIDVDRILEIPLSSRRYNDLWAWHYERKGLFSVRSAYNMLINIREKREAWFGGKDSWLKHSGSREAVDFFVEHASTF
jgi:hypothetical protein